MLYIFRRWLAMAGKWKASLPLPLRGCALAPVTRGALPLLGSSSGLYYSSSARSKSGAIQERELSSSSRSSLTPCPRCGSCGGRLKGEADDLCPPCCASELRIIGDGTSPPKLGMPPAAHTTRGTQPVIPLLHARHGHWQEQVRGYVGEAAGARAGIGLRCQARAHGIVRGKMPSRKSPYRSRDSTGPVQRLKCAARS